MEGKPTPSLSRLPVALGAALALAALLAAPAVARAGYTLVGWNNLGMHCMDADFAVLSLLPPYNTIHAQLIDPQGRLVTNPTGYSVTYEAIADPDGSINTTSAGKTNFWSHVLALFGASPSIDVGIGPRQAAMPGAANLPQVMTWDTTLGWFVAEGIPLTPIDDAGHRNAYPLMHLVARDAAGTILATTDIVLPVSDEMDCHSCHASGSGPAAQPAAGWVNDPDPQHDVRLNILSLHDDRQATDPTYQTALAARGYDPAGLYATASGGRAILCASCHLSEALPGSGLAGIEPLTRAIHTHHGPVLDPTTNQTLDATTNRSACYRCHPGSTTRCLRGAMGAAVAADGTLAMQCQSCHGTMSVVGAPTRTGWLNEPGCQSCHTGTAVTNAGQIRFTSVFDAPGHVRQPADGTFATNANTPAPGLSLYRFSAGHGGLKCEGCHGSTHAEFPSIHRNDNIQTIQHQGHVGTLVECASCHGGNPATITGGPHGMHPVGQVWVNTHSDATEGVGVATCRACHGTDYRGTVLSRAQGDRTIGAFGTKVFWRGFQIGCYTCHAGPGSENGNPNRPAVVQDAAASTPTDTPATIALTATDSDRDPLTLRIVTQAAHGTVALANTAATYFPESGFTGSDLFTFAAWDGSTDSNLGTVTVDVGGCGYAIVPTSRSFTAAGGADAVTVSAAAGCAWAAATAASWITIAPPGAGSGPGTVGYTVAPNTDVSGRTGTITIAGGMLTVSQSGTGPAPDLAGTWITLVQTCRGSGATMRCRLRGRLTVVNQGAVRAGPSILRIILSNTPSGGSATILKDYKIPALKPGRQRKRGLSVRLPLGSSASAHFVVAVIDAMLQVPESDETNNVVPFGPVPG